MSKILTLNNIKLSTKKPDQKVLSKHLYTMSISIAKPYDFIEIVYLIKVCSIEMNSAGGNYSLFFRPQIPDLIEKGHLYKYTDNESIVAILALNTGDLDEYKNISWQYTSGNVLFIRILIHPRWRKFMIGKEFLDIAEKYATDNNYQSVRLDIFADNSIAQEILNQAKYKKAGEIALPFQNTSYLCFEKQI